MLVVIFLSEHLCGVCQGTVSQRILKVIRHGLIHEVAWEISVFHPMLLASVRSEGRSLHRLKGEFIVNSREPLYNSVGHRDDSWISDHAVGLAAMQMPYREFALLLVDSEHGVDHVCVSLALEYAVKRHRCPVSVPE